MNTARHDTAAVGRPPKFNEVRRPVTVTLPQRILDLLAMVDVDRARAIARVTEATVGTDPSEQRRVDLIEIGPGQCVVVIGQCEHLHRIPWLKLVEIAPARNLLIIPPGTPIEALEVALADLIEDAMVDSKETVILNDLRLFISRMRRENRISKGEIIFFTTQPTARRKGDAPN